MLFATTPNVSKVGSYTANNGTDVYVDCGFSNSVRFLMVKNITTADATIVFDSQGGIVDGEIEPFFKIAGNYSLNTQDHIDPYNTGFKVKASSALLNNSTDTYVFYAVA
jgi:hypothetical protein